MAAQRVIPAEYEVRVREEYEAGGENGRTGVLAARFTDLLRNDGVLPEGKRVSEDAIRAAVVRAGGTLRGRGGQKGLRRNLPGTSTVSSGPTATEVAEDNQAVSAG